MTPSSQPDPVHASPGTPVSSPRPAGSRGRGPVASSGLRRYGVAVLATAAVLLGRLALDAVLAGRAVFLPSTLAVLVSALYGGLGPGLLATGLSASVIGLVWLEPRWTPAVALLTDSLALVVFVGVGLGISALVAQLQRVRRRAEAEVAERERAEDAFRRAHEALEQRVRERTSQLSAINDELLREITQRQALEQTLQEQQRLRVALESSAVAFTILRAVRDETARLLPEAWLLSGRKVSIEGHEGSEGRLQRLHAIVTGAQVSQVIRHEVLVEGTDEGQPMEGQGKLWRRQTFLLLHAPLMWAL